MKEYKVLTQKRRFFSGTFNPQKLSETLNGLAEQGWEVVSSSIDAAGVFGQSKVMTIILEREVKE